MIFTKQFKRKCKDLAMKTQMQTNLGVSVYFNVFLASLLVWNFSIAIINTLVGGVIIRIVENKKLKYAKRSNGE